MQRTIDDLPPESVYRVKRSIPVKITHETEGVDVYHAEVDENNPQFSGIHTYGSTEEESFQLMRKAVCDHFKRHMEYPERVRKGRVMTRINMLNKYLELR